ncbi:MAG: hypothetical protein HY774_12340 [Acidobacteria bacterium]|nr:hypothetical protein [Acidobacteriota bacterium]
MQILKYRMALGLVMLGLVINQGVIVSHFDWVTSAQPSIPAMGSVESKLDQQDHAHLSSEDGLWHTVKTDFSPGSANPQSPTFHSFTLNQKLLEQLLSQVSLSARPEQRPVLSVPMPDGTYSRFGIYETSVMEPELAAKFPEIRTFAGKGIDDAGANLRLTQSPQGFHFNVLSNQGMVTIRPKAGPEGNLYLVYNTHTASEAFNEFECYVTPEMEQLAQTETVGEFEETRALLSATVPHRTFRLAVSATAEYSQLIWKRPKGPISEVMAQIVSLVSAANLVYGKELAIEFVLVNGIDQLIFENTQTDPFSGTLGQRAEQNQRTLDRTIGSQNYDIGHLLDASSGGIGYIGGVCTTEHKAKGVTATNSALTIIHELGHQLGALHTFNSTAAECSGNRSSSAAYEVGSGTTIMSYGGKCKPEVVQGKPDLYFHTDSLERILSRLENPPAQLGPDCSIQTSTGHLRPLVEAGQNYTIPFKTPFTLVATETSPGAQITYCWEEFDLGLASPPQSGIGTQPIFRSFPPVTSPARTFPRLENVLNNTSQFGEALPQTARTLKFRCTVRDQAGGFNFDSITVSVLSTGVGFAVTKPNTAVTFRSGSSQTITWSTARTNVNPINCAQVRILLSIDGGYTYTPLIDSTPNDGSQVVTLPSGINTTQARIKIEAIGNIFFDVSNVNFKITP